MSKREEAILENLQILINKLNPEDLKFLNDQMEIIEALKLSSVGSRQFGDLNMQADLDLNRIYDLTGLNYNEILLLCSIEGHYVSNRISGERQAYKHVLKDYVSLTPFCSMLLDEGDSYFHPYQLPHRLYYDNKILNSTILVTTEVPSNPEGGSLQRPTYVQKEEQSYDKIVLNSESLAKILTDYLDYLNTHWLPVKVSFREIFCWQFWKKETLMRYSISHSEHTYLECLKSHILVMMGIELKRITKTSKFEETYASRAFKNPVLIKSFTTTLI